MKTDVCIVGDGIVGRTLSLLLAQIGLEVTLVQAAPNSTSLVSGSSSSPSSAPLTDVRAYALSSASQNILQSVRAWPSQPEAIGPISAMRIFDGQNLPIRFDAKAMQTDALAFMVAAPTLLDNLAQAIRFSPKVTLSNTIQEATLQVICEGRSGQLREQLGVEFTSQSYEQTAVAFKVSHTHSHEQVARQWFENGEIIAMLPMTNQECSVVWSCSPAKAQQLLALQNQSEAITELLSGVGQGVLGATYGKISLLSACQAWPLVRSTAKTWYGHGWLLAGDAAHTVHPLTGQGLNLGLADAAELCQVLANRPAWRSIADAKLLAQYQRARKLATLTNGGGSDLLHQIFTNQNPFLAKFRQIGVKGFNMIDPIKNLVAQQVMN